MSLQVNLSLLDVLLQLSICLVLGSGIQGYVSHPHNYRSYRPCWSLQIWWSFSSWGTRGSSFRRSSTRISSSRWSWAIRRSSFRVSFSRWSFAIGGPPPGALHQGFLFQVALLLGILLQGSSVSMWLSGLIFIVSIFRVFPPSTYNSSLYVGSSLGGVLPHSVRESAHSLLNWMYCRDDPGTIQLRYVWSCLRSHWWWS